MSVIAFWWRQKDGSFHQPCSEECRSAHFSIHNLLERPETNVFAARGSAAAFSHLLYSLFRYQSSFLHPFRQLSDWWNKPNGSVFPQKHSCFLEMDANNSFSIGERSQVGTQGKPGCLGDFQSFWGAAMRTTLGIWHLQGPLSSQKRWLL